MYFAIALILLVSAFVAAFFGILFNLNPFFGLIFASLYLLWILFGDKKGK